MDVAAYKSVDRFDVYCAWPADDIVLIDNWDKEITIGLTVAQAESIVAQLQVAIREVYRLNKDVEDYLRVRNQ